MIDAAPQSIEELEERLSRPSESAVRVLAGLDGDLVLLGCGGKMGPTMARMIIRGDQAAGVKRRVLAVSRFSDRSLPQRLEALGIETRSCDLLDPQSVAALPRVPNVIYMAGMKFGASGNPSLTWAMNGYAPTVVCSHFCDSRIAAFSSGNIYPLVPLASGGSRETDPVGPIGEYAMTVLARERMFEYFSRAANIPVAILRLNYATELRYGVLVDLARQVAAGEPVDLSMPMVNVIWQADANAMAIAALAHVSVPPRMINLAGPEMLRVRDVAERFGELLRRPVRFTGVESDRALLNNGSLGRELLGQPTVAADQIIRWTADWVARGGEHLGKPTHFQVRDGKF